MIFIHQISFSQPPKYSNEFLSIGVSARGHGMSNAQVAHIDDVTAAFWNPAGLARLDSNAFQVSLMHAEWFAGIAKYDYVGMGKALKKSNGSAIGLSIIRFAVDEIPNTLSLISDEGAVNYNNITEFSSADYAVLFSYARHIWKVRGLTVGGNTKVIRRVVGGFGKAWGFGFDLGLQYAFNRWQFGLVGKDLTSTFNTWSFDFTEKERNVFIDTGNDIPINTTEITRPSFVMGLARRIVFGKRQLELLTEFTADITTDGKRNVLLSGNPLSIAPHMGIELSYFPARKSILQSKAILYEPREVALFLRAGIRNIQRVEKIDNPAEDFFSVQPDFGVGIKLRYVVVDYALTSFGNVSQALYSHIISLRIDLIRREKTKPYMLSPRNLLTK